MGRSETDLRKLCPEADVRKGLALTGSRVQGAREQVEAWLKSQGILK